MQEAEQWCAWALLASPRAAGKQCALGGQIWSGALALTGEVEISTGLATLVAALCIFLLIVISRLFQVLRSVCRVHCIKIAALNVLTFRMRLQCASACCLGIIHDNLPWSMHSFFSGLSESLHFHTHHMSYA
jgi:hypothetical protein